ncbi:MAG TPA: ferritin [Miltoncostaeaceae bacterium]|jgi:ferritin|nr:ferritin [Miltoncostaeaceae bacterium]
MPVAQDVIESLNAQLGKELEAHLQYLAISSWFDSEGLPELAGFFARQAAEEHEHAMRFLAYIQDVGGPVVIPALAAPKPSFESAEEAVATSLEAEEDVTARIDAIMDQAIAARDHATQAFLQWFVTEQVEEVSTMGELLQVTRRAGERNLLLLEDYVARLGGSEGAGE